MPSALPGATSKTCSKCKVVKLLEEFTKQRNRPDGLAVWCRECHRAKQKEYVKNNPIAAAAVTKRSREKNADTRESERLMRRYGISLETYHAMLLAQGGQCKLCDRRSAGTYKLAVDHCHETGRVRGLLCLPCNGALHYLENAEWFSKAKDYLT